MTNVSIKFMRNTTLTVFFSFLSLCLCIFPLIFPAWLQQSYSSTSTTYQGFGLFAFYSTNNITNPFYGSDTMLQYSEFCGNQAKGRPSPNWMLGNGEKYADVLCGTHITVIQFIMYGASIITGLSLLASIAACFNPVIGYAERSISITTFCSSLCLLAALILWSVYFQQRLLEIDVLQTSYSQCQVYNSSDSTWSCWFYGYSFWVAISCVVSLLMTTSASAAGRTAKIRQFRKEYEHNLVIALHESAAMVTTHQPLTTPTTSSDRELARAIQQSREQHELELAMQQSLYELEMKKTREHS